MGTSDAKENAMECKKYFISSLVVAVATLMCCCAQRTCDSSLKHYDSETLQDMRQDTFLVYKSSKELFVNLDDGAIGTIVIQDLSKPYCIVRRGTGVAVIVVGESDVSYKDAWGNALFTSFQAAQSLFAFSSAAMSRVPIVPSIAIYTEMRSRQADGMFTVNRRPIDLDRFEHAGRFYVLMCSTWNIVPNLENHDRVVHDESVEFYWQESFEENIVTASKIYTIK